MQDQKKVGPNLKEMHAKLRKEWLPVWLSDPRRSDPEPRCRRSVWRMTK